MAGCSSSCERPAVPPSRIAIQTGQIMSVPVVPYGGVRSVLVGLMGCSCTYLESSEIYCFLANVAGRKGGGKVVNGYTHFVVDVAERGKRWKAKKGGMSL